MNIHWLIDLFWQLQLFGGDLNEMDQPLAKSPFWNDKIRPIETGLINFLHTTDTHGWYLGHLNQRQYSGDWGDFVSFESHIRAQVQENGGDLITIDTGDRHDGNGLSDLTAVNGQFSNEVFSAMEYDLVTVGNHELYKADISELEFNTLVPLYGERFISTNVKYRNDDGEWVIFGNSTHRYFQTEVNKLNVLALSFLFDFKWYNDRVKVEPIESVIRSRWFISLLQEFQENPVDIIVIFGHLPVTHQWLEMELLHKTIRSYFPGVTIQYFGGHSHIRDFTILDRKSTGLQSGRYCETIGFLSIKDLEGESDKSNVFRSYIDFNKHSFISHSGTTMETFDTDHGLEITNKLINMSMELQLDETYGYVPHSFYTSAADYQHHDSNSLLRFLEGPILNQLESMNCDTDVDLEFPEFNNSRIILINTGGIRYDMYKGPFTKNSLFTVSPFKNKWKVVPNVPKVNAMKLKDILNNGPFILSNKSLKSPRQLALDSKPMYVQEMDFEFKDEKKSYGLVTIDDFGNDGDDTIHRPFHNYYVPNVIQSYNDVGGDLVDVIYYDFIEPFILSALKDACGKQGEEQYLALIDEVQFYNNCENESNLGQLLKRYVQENWQV